MSYIWKIIVYFIVFILFFVSVFIINKEIDKKENDFLNSLNNEKLKIKYILYSSIIKNNLTFNDYFVLLKIAYAESCLNHFDENGELIKGKKNKNDIGLFQINKIYHQVNNDDLIEHINYAIYLYKKDKTKHWVYSKKNWNKDIKELKKMCNDF